MGTDFVIEKIGDKFKHVIVIKIDVSLDILLSSERRDVMKLLHEFFAPLPAP